MAVDFSKFDQKVDLQELQKEVHDAPESNFADVPDGDYEVSLTAWKSRRLKQVTN